jgi:hypothetical protein
MAPETPRRSTRVARKVYTGRKKEKKDISTHVSIHGEDREGEKSSR